MKNLLQGNRDDDDDGTNTSHSPCGCLINLPCCSTCIPCHFYSHKTSEREKERARAEKRVFLQLINVISVNNVKYLSGCIFILKKVWIGSGGDERESIRM